MEGTRNERAVVVILSYVIGFVTAYIAFALSIYQHSVTGITVPAAKTAPMAIDATPTPPTELAVDGPDVMYDNGRLTITVDGESRLLSVRADVIGYTDQQIAAQPQGVHTDGVGYLLADDGTKLLLCEQRTSEAVCSAFVYSIDENIVRSITRNGEPVVVSLDDTTGIVWTEDGLLEYNGAVSVSADTPWILETIE